MLRTTSFCALLYCCFAWGCLELAPSTCWAITAPPSWKTPEDVTTSNGIDHVDGQDRFLDFDHFGVPAFVATDNANFAPKTFFWRRNQVAGWTSTLVDEGTPLPDVDPLIHGSLAFDHSERPVIAFVHGDLNDAVVSQVAANGFTYEHEELTGGAAEDENAGTSVAIDPLGRIGVAYVSGGAPSIRFALDVDGNGQFDDGTGGNPFQMLVSSGIRPSLAFDPQARPVIGLIGTDDKVKVADADLGSGFGISVPDPNADSSFVSLAINPLTGYPCVAYNDLRANELKYAEFDGLQWNAETVYAATIAMAASTMSVSLAFDPADGNPAIAFAGDRQLLDFAWHDGATWNLQTVDPRTGIAGGAVSLAFNEAFPGGFGNGLPAIAYVSANGSYHYVEDPPLAGPPGDFNGDLVVDGTDFLAWQIGLGSIYDGDDLADWEQFYGADASGSTVAVPEPSGLATLLAATFAFGFVCRTRYRELRSK